MAAQPDYLPAWLALQASENCATPFMAHIEDILDAFRHAVSR
jgi:hypothetical protein